MKKQINRVGNQQQKVRLNVSVSLGSFADLDNFALGDESTVSRTYPEAS